MDGSVRVAATIGARRKLIARRLPDEIASVLAQEIRGAVLKPGDCLPSEKQLCVRFGVSRTVVREAISQLKSDGLVRSQQGRGAFVADPSQALVFRISPECFAKRKELGHFLELLTNVTAQAAALAAQRRSAAQLAQMNLTLERMAEALVVGEQAAEQWVEAENELYQVIAEASGNPYFVEFLSFLRSRIGTRLRSVVIKNARAVEISAAVMPEHRAIFEAIRRRDVERAQNLARAHFTAAAGRLAARADFADV
jgi:GntR family transcriptional regulator, transcriptional repressor for pyruvate dehydrogenase complex